MPPYTDNGNSLRRILGLWSRSISKVYVLVGVDLYREISIIYKRVLLSIVITISIIQVL